MDGKEVDPYKVFNDRYVRVEDGRSYDFLGIMIEDDFSESKYVKDEDILERIRRYY